MSIRYEQREAQVAYLYVDHLGYLYCHACTPAEHRPELLPVAPPHGTDRCDQCGRVVDEVTVPVCATMAVEYVPCRIF